MITIDSSFWSAVGVVSSDGNAKGNQYDFYNYIEMSNGETITNQYEFFKNSPVDGVYYNDQYDWYRAVGVLYSEPIIDEYSFYQNVSVDGINPIENQYEFFKALTDALGFVIQHSFLYDGVSKYTNIDDALTPLATTTKGAWLVQVKPTLGLPSGNQRIVCFGDTDGIEQISIFQNSAGLLRAGCDVGGVSQWLLNTTNPVFADNTNITIALIHNGIEPRILINGVLVAQSFAIGTDKTAWFNNATGLDNGSVATRRQNNSVDNYFDGYNNQVSFLNNDITNSEFLDWHNSGKPKSAYSLFPTKTVYVYNPDESVWNGSNWITTDAISGIVATSVNMLEIDKTTVTPY